jgi:ParB/RepB/Spo0J family partition protein
MLQHAGIEQRIVPLDQITESATNPRKHFGDMKELEDSVREKGVLQPVLLRPFDGEYELVAGARRFRAARGIGLAEIPAIIRELSDAEALEVQVIENNQRSDVSPLEEADGFRALQEKHGYSVEDLAAKTGRSKAYVYARLKLAELGEAGREAVAAGKLSASVALLVARVPAALQHKAVGLVTPQHAEIDPLSARHASRLLQDRFMLHLAEAPFDRKDAGYPGGACVACPKRTGAQPDLFADVDDADTCTDPSCFEAKVDEAWKRRKAAAKVAGLKVIDGKDAKALWPHAGGRGDVGGGEYASARDAIYVNLSANHGRSLSVAELLGPAAKVVALARNPHTGEIVELYDRSAAAKAAKEREWKKGKPAKAEKAVAAPPPGATPAQLAAAAAERERAKKEKEAQRKREEKARREIEVKELAAARGVDLLVDRAQRRGIDVDFIREIARWEIGHDHAPLERRGVEKFNEAKARDKYIDGLTKDQLCGLIAEAMLGEPFEAYRQKYTDRFVEACKAHKVDLKKLEADVRAELEAKAANAVPANVKPVAKKRG